MDFDSSYLCQGLEDQQQCFQEKSLQGHEHFTSPTMHKVHNQHAVQIELAGDRHSVFWP